MLLSEFLMKKQLRNLKHLDLSGISSISNAINLGQDNLVHKFIELLKVIFCTKSNITKVHLSSLGLESMQIDKN